MWQQPGPNRQKWWSREGPTRTQTETRQIISRPKTHQPAAPRVDPPGRFLRGRAKQSLHPRTKSGAVHPMWREHALELDRDDLITVEADEWQAASRLTWISSGRKGGLSGGFSPSILPSWINRENHTTPLMMNEVVVRKSKLSPGF